MITLNTEGLAELKKVFGSEGTCSACGSTNFSERTAFCKNCDMYGKVYPSYIYRLHCIMDVMLFRNKSYSEAFEIEKKNYERSKYREEPVPDLKNKGEL